MLHTSHQCYHFSSALILSLIYSTVFDIVFINSYFQPHNSSQRIRESEQPADMKKKGTNNNNNNIRKKH